MLSKIFSLRNTISMTIWVLCILQLPICSLHATNITKIESLTDRTVKNLSICLNPTVCQEFKKTINREFGTTADGMTALYNKYGKVNVNTWGNNSVKIDITIVVNANKQSEADRIFNRINVNFTNTAGYVKAETIINTESGGWGWGGWNNGNDGDYQINYEVYMPVANQLDLKNKYGDSYLGNMNGKLIAEIKYGDLRTENINNNCELNLGYGKATFAKIGNLNGQISYGELSLSDSKDIQLDTKYSDMHFDKSDRLRLVSKYDEIEVGTTIDFRLQTKYSDVKANNVRSAYLTTQYTDIKIDNLSELVDADMSYGSLTVSDINKGFQSATLKGQYTDFVVGVGRGGNFKFDAEGSYSDIKYPSGATIRRHEEQSSWESIKGFMGDENTKSFVKVKMNYGDLVIK
jgi:hypothetical protein